MGLPERDPSGARSRATECEAGTGSNGHDALVEQIGGHRPKTFVRLSPAACWQVRAGRPLIDIKASGRYRVHTNKMSDGPTSTNEVICPVCGRPMVLLHTIRRAFAENLKVFKCKPCGFSTTEPASWTTPPSSQVSATTAARQKR